MAAEKPFSGEAGGVIRVPRGVSPRAWELFLRIAPGHSVFRLDKPAELSRLIELAVRVATAFEVEAPRVASRLAEQSPDPAVRPGGDAAR